MTVLGAGSNAGGGRMAGGAAVAAGVALVALGVPVGPVQNPKYPTLSVFDTLSEQRFR